MSRYQQPGFLETIVITIGKGLWSLVSWPFKKLFGIKEREKFNKVENLKKWLEIEKLLESGDIIHAEQAVIRADRFLDNNLKIAGALGETFADRLRDFEDHFNHDTYQLVWSAHKLRNKIAHEENDNFKIDDCKNALKEYRKGLENIKAL